MSAGIWLQCSLADTTPGSRISIGSVAPVTSFVRFMGPRFILNDGEDYGIVGWGCDIIDGGVPGGGGGGGSHPTYFILGF